MEIVRPPPLSAAEARSLEYHSVFNLLSVSAASLEEAAFAFPELREPLHAARLECLSTYHALWEGQEPQPLLQSVTKQLEQSHLHLQAARRGAVNGHVLPAKLLDECLHELRQTLDSRSRELAECTALATTWEWRALPDSEADLRNFWGAARAYALRPSRPHPTVETTVTYRWQSCDDRGVFVPPRFGDILRDLFANARKFTPPGGQITVALDQQPDELVGVVEDTGRGIPPAEISRVVEYGYRATNARDIASHGLGFGLSKAVHSILRHQGRFWIASRLGEGTRIRLTLPRPAVEPPRRSRQGAWLPPRL